MKYSSHTAVKEILSIQLEDCTLSAGLKMILNRYQYYNIQNKKDDDIYNDMRGIIPEKVIEPKGKLLGYIGRCAYYLRFRNSDPGYEIYEFSFDTNTETDLLKRPLGKYCDAHFSYSVKGSYFSGYRTEEKVVLEMIEEIDPIPYSPFLATVRYEIKRKSGKSILQKQTVSLEYRDKITLCNYVKGVNTTVSNDNTVTIRGTDIKGNKWDV